MRRCYSILSTLYGILAATILLMPDRTLGRRLATKVGCAAGFGLATGISILLKKANDIDHLHGASFKQLNLGLLGFSLLGLFAVPGEAAFLPTAGPAILLSATMNAARLFGVAVAYRGWSRGVSSREEEAQWLSPLKATKELLQGIQSTLRGMRVPNETKKRSLSYRNCLLLVLTCMMSCFMEGVFYIRYRGSAIGRSLFEISLQWSSVARLFLVSSMIYSLKDMADRERMSKGTMFIKLNLMIGAWAILVGIGQNMTPAARLAPNIKIEMLALSLLFFLKGFKAWYLKTDLKVVNAPALDLPQQGLENGDDEE
ncbi:expressed unknown protein [Seminavis robusta]|uniref:Uncharacterized protein n=1 Tax=Seminavis robusta TaxID=568900 RepID=A0A9N8HUA5_9STRA|nr:expressed unknown protein [Seminavis robusta]|eukprot:Sro1629_g287150.1 n/a (314) ;mRNA; f:21576-22744